MLTIDGSYGEGGGQILRSSLGLSLVTGKPFEIVNIRANREKSGLLKQHLTAVNAAVEISNAKVVGNSFGSRNLVFEPGTVKAGEYRFIVGTAGSATLVLQTILPALLTTHRESKIFFEGGTHNPCAPPFDFLKYSFLQILNKMGAQVIAEIEHYGFYPAGGGTFSVTINPFAKLNRIEIVNRGDVLHIFAKAMVAKLPIKIAKDELTIIKEALGLSNEDCKVMHVSSPGPGNAVLVEIVCDHVTFVGTAFGAKKLPLEKVALEVIQQAKAYLDTHVPVCEHLADQLLIPCALAGGGMFRTVKPTLHTMTNIEIIKQFLDIGIEVKQVENKVWEINVFEK